MYEKFPLIFNGCHAFLSESNGSFLTKNRCRVNRYPSYFPQAHLVVFFFQKKKKSFLETIEALLLRHIHPKRLPRNRLLGLECNQNLTSTDPTGQVAWSDRATPSFSSIAVVHLRAFSSPVASNQTRDARLHTGATSGDAFFLLASISCSRVFTRVSASILLVDCAP